MKSLPSTLFQMLFGSVILFCVTLEARAESRLSVGHDLTLAPSETYDRIICLGCSVDFSGKTNELVVIGGHVILQDTAVVRGNVIVIGGTLHWEKEATIGGRTFNIGGGSKFKDVFELMDMAMAAHSLWEMVSLKDLLKLFFSMSLSALSVLFYFPLRNSAARGLKTLEKKPFMSLFAGVAVWFMALFLVLVTVFSLVGILILPVVLAVLFVGLGFVSMIMSVSLGQQLRHFKIKLPPFVEFTLGLHVLLAVYFFIPYSFWGLGIALMMITGAAFIASSQTKATS